MIDYVIFKQSHKVLNLVSPPPLTSRPGSKKGVKWDALGPRGLGLRLEIQDFKESWPGYRKVVNGGPRGGPEGLGVSIGVARGLLGPQGPRAPRP